MFKKSFIIIILLNLDLFLMANGALYFKSVKLDCFPEPKYFHANFSCRLKPINRYKSVGIMDVHIKNILRNISANLSLFARNGANVFKPFLINNTQNACNWMNNKKGGPYIGFIMKSLLKFTNINHSCPYTGALSARNLYIDTSIIPLPLPINSYKLQVLFYEGYPLDYMGTVSYYIDVIEAQGLQENLWKIPIDVLYSANSAFDPEVFDRPLDSEI